MTYKIDGLWVNFLMPQSLPNFKPKVRSYGSFSEDLLRRESSRPTWWTMVLIMARKAGLKVNSSTFKWVFLPQTFKWYVELHMDCDVIREGDL